MQVGSTRWTMVLLGAALLTPTARGTYGAEGRSHHVQAPATRVIEPSLRQRAVPGPISASAFSPWRMRRKAVLEETDHRVTEETDLGPVQLPRPQFALMLKGLIRPHLPSAPPLRC